MEPPNDDGYTTAVKCAGIFMLAVVLMSSCHKPKPVIAVTLHDSITKVVVAPPAASPEKKPIHKKKKKLYLTFDDGPNKGTSNALHIVQDEKIPVSFFIVGEHVFASAGQTRQWDSLWVAENTALCNHSYTHAHNNYNKFYQSPDSVVNDFQRAQDSLHLTNNIVRTPGRNIWRTANLNFTDLKSSTAAADSLQKAGFIVMGWDLEWHFDAKSMSVTSTAIEIMAQIDSAFAKNKTMQTDHLVLLAHDQVYKKPDDSVQLRKFLQGIKLKDEYELA